VDRDYRNAFREYGLTVESLDPNEEILNLDEAATRIRVSAIRDRLVAALDDWVLTKGLAGFPGRDRLLAIARQADPDPWRDRLRETFGRRDRKTLVQLARDQKVLDQAPATVLLLAMGLSAEDEYALAVAVLRQAQQRHPNDFWLNQNLAEYLLQTEPP